MYIITLLCRPDQNIVTSALANSIQGAWGGRDFKWLDPLNACEFEVLSKPENLWSVWDDMQALGVDLICQSAGVRRRKMLLADMDSTMIQQECIDELADEAGVGAQVAKITAAAMNGELDFEGALRERVGLLRGLPVDVIDKVFAERITFMPGGRELVQTMKANSGYTALVSGGFTVFTTPVAATLGMDFHRANELLIHGETLAGEVGDPIIGRDAKVATLNELAKARGIDAQDVIAVGDGANDLGMLKLAGTGVALHAKPVVQAEVSVRVNHGDLTALLYLQGYSKTEFVS